MSAPDLKAIFRAGFVRRWHTNPDLAHTVDRIDGHSARVARILLAVHPSPSLELIRTALIHDDGESATGDVSATFKRSMPGILRVELAAQESGHLIDLWGYSDPMPDCDTGCDAQWLKFADRLDAYMWAAHHAPHVLNGDGWPEALEWLFDMAETLGCTGALRSAVACDEREGEGAL